MHSAFVLYLTLFSAYIQATPRVASEAQLKAAFLFNFTKFIEWPASSFSSAESAIVIGIVGETPVIQALNTIVAGRKVNGRDVIVAPIATPAHAKTAHLIYVAGDDRQHSGAILQTLRTVSVPLVADEKSCAALHASICFLQRADQLRFSIDATSSQRAGFKISSHLQKLAANSGHR